MQSARTTDPVIIATKQRTDSVLGTSEHEIHINNIKKYHLFLMENTLLLHYKN